MLENEQFDFFTHYVCPSVDLLARKAGNLLKLRLLQTKMLTNAKLYKAPNKPIAELVLLSPSYKENLLPHVQHEKRAKFGNVRIKI